MQLIKLNSRGIAHHLVLAVLVVGTAIGGSYYVLASHADVCNPVTSPTTAPVSGVTCSPTTSPTTAPTSAPTGKFASCTITNVPAGPAPGTSFTPTLTITNNGTVAYNAHITSFVNLNPGTTVSFKPWVISKLAVGSSTSQSLGSYTVPSTATTANKGVVKAHNIGSSLACSTSFIVDPVKP